jgi:hypothetical protein
MATSEKNRADEDLASDLAAAIDILPRLLRGRHLHHHHGLKGIRVDVGPAKGDDQGPEVIDCKVTIEADDAASLKAIKGKFKASDGWTCTDGKNNTSVCTNP